MICVQKQNQADSFSSFTPFICNGPTSRLFRNDAISIEAWNILLAAKLAWRSCPVCILSAWTEGMLCEWVFGMLCACVEFVADITECSWLWIIAGLNVLAAKDSWERPMHCWQLAGGLALGAVSTSGFNGDKVNASSWSCTPEPKIKNLLNKRT